MGIDVLDMSLATAVDYDEAAQRLTFENLAIDMAKVGKIALKGTVEGVPPEAFSGKPEAAQMAMAMASVKSLEIEAADAGMIGLILAQQSATTGMPADQLREQFAAMPVAALPQVLGQTPQVAELANALGSFMRSGGTLIVPLGSDAQSWRKLFAAAELPVQVLEPRAVTPGADLRPFFGPQSEPITGRVLTLPETAAAWKLRWTPEGVTRHDGKPLEGLLAAGLGPSTHTSS